MERKYPASMFWLFVVMNFFVRFFYLFIPGLILCVVGIWVKKCLWIGLAILTFDFILSIMDQLRIRKYALTPSDNPEYNELMNAFYGPDGLHAVREIVDGKTKPINVVEHHNEEN